MDALAKSEPDGYTLGVANTGNIVINPYLFPAMPYDPLKDLTPVGVLGTVPLFLVMNSNVPAKSLAEFIAYTKANPDKISYASAGAGTTPDLAAHEFARRAGLKFVMVPFRGTGPAVQAVLGGDVHATFVSMGPHIEFVRQGKLRVLGAATAQRPSYLPDTPTFAEQGFSGFRNRHLVRAVRAARHAAADRRSAQRLYAFHAGRPGSQAPAGSDFRRSR